MRGDLCLFGVGKITSVNAYRQKKKKKIYVMSSIRPGSLNIRFVSIKSRGTGLSIKNPLTLTQSQSIRV